MLACSQLHYTKKLFTSHRQATTDRNPATHPTPQHTTQPIHSSLEYHCARAFTVDPSHDWQLHE